MLEDRHSQRRRENLSHARVECRDAVKLPNCLETIAHAAVLFRITMFSVQLCKRDVALFTKIYLMGENCFKNCLSVDLSVAILLALVSDKIVKIDPFRPSVTLFHTSLLQAVFHSVKRATNERRGT